MTTQVPVRIRLHLKAERQSRDIGIKHVDRDPVRGAQLKFEHGGRIIRARVGAINRQSDDSVTAIEAIEV